MLSKVAVARSVGASFFSLRVHLMTLTAIVAVSPMALAADLPTGGVVTAGTGTIRQSGSSMTVTQTSDRMVTDWQSFSIGQGRSVNFVQPSASSVALNRVLGSDVSVIQGALTANGKIFLVNPNGVLFTPTAQVNAGAIVASTLSISTQDFLAGNYRFSGDSSRTVENQGRIEATGIDGRGGTIALIAARVVNSGTLTATGGNVLIGAGSMVTLDLGGPVKIQVEKGALDALIEQGGAISASGGLVYLTAKSAGDLASRVINHTGVTEAQTLATGAKGEIYLLGDMRNGSIEVAGTLDASAPVGGDGGFIETSAAKVRFAPGARVTTSAPRGRTGRLLIDPTDYRIAATGGDETGAALAARLATTNVQIDTTGAGSGNGDIFVNDAVTWSANQLTLTASRNIVFNSTVTATDSARIALEYGQATADGAGGTYSFGSGAKLFIPAANAFTWKKGSAGTTTNLVFNNGSMRFGDGTQESIDALGQLRQPFYFDNVTSGRNGFFKLTFSNFPLDMELGIGGDGSSSWNRNGTLMNTQNGMTTVGRRLEVSGFKEGAGTIEALTSFQFADVASTVLAVTNTFSLQPGDPYVRIDTKVANPGSSTVDNMRLWVGTRDDFVASTDRPTKVKGNLTAEGFVATTDRATRAAALNITERQDGSGAAILFYSTNENANTSINRCCSFTNATGIDPVTSQLQRGPEDGSYALFMRLPNLAAGQFETLTWFYAAAPAARLADLGRSVAQASGAAAPEPTPTPTSPVTPRIAAVENVATLVRPQPVTRQPASQSVGFAPAPSVISVGSANGAPSFVGSLDVITVRSPGAVAASPSQGGLVQPTGPSGTSTVSNIGGEAPLAPALSVEGMRSILGEQAGSLGGPLRMFVVDGGLRAPVDTSEQR